MKTTNKPKFSRGQDVIFERNGRRYQGHIIGWAENSSGTIWYDIGSNKRTYHVIGESEIQAKGG